MSFARVLTAASGCVLLGATIAACSGSFGSGTNSPIPLGSLGPSGPATPTPPATSSSVVLTYGESDAFQNLPVVGGYSGAIAFPAAPAPTIGPAPKPGKNGASPTPAPMPTALSVAIGATLFDTKPDEGPDLNFVSGKGKSSKGRAHPARALIYIKLLPTHDVTLASYPRIAVDIPRDLASEYRDGEFGIALWNSGEKDEHYRLAVVQRDASSSPPPITRATIAPIPTVPPSGAPAAGASPVPSPSASATIPPATHPAGRLAFGGGDGHTAPGPSGSPGVAPAAASATLPPQRLLFAATATPLHLVANRPAIFALYALPSPATTPAPAPSAARGAASAAKGSASAAPSAAASAGAVPLPASSPAAPASPAVSSAAPAPAHS
jgi:hypothetical protein